MADPVNPTGQPNPFQSPSQGISSNVSLSTGSAEETMVHLQKVIENCAKSFGVAFTAATKDTLKGQENFYKYIGDKENERRIALERYKRAAIDSIDEETKAKIKSYEQEKHSQEEVNRYSGSLTKKAAEDKLHIGRETDKQLARSTGIGGVIRGVTSSLGGQIGGPVGGLISGAGNLLTNPYALAIGAILEMFNTKAAFTKTGAQLAGAGLGLGGGPAGTGLHFATSLFNQSMFGPAGDFGQALSAEQQRGIIGTMAGSRTMIGQATGGGFGAIAGNLGLFANILPDASKEMELFTAATKDLGMSQKDISRTFMTTKVSADRLGITQLDAISAQMEMQKALRNITNDGTVAANVLYNVGSFFHDIGKSETETKRMTLGIGAAGANLPLSQIAGMFAFTQGKMPTEGALFGPGGMLGKDGSGVFGLMGSYLSKVGGQFKDPMQRIYAADSLNRQLGLGIQTQDLPKFFELSNRLMTGGIDQEDYAKKVAELSKHGRELTVTGMDTLANIVDPINRLENVFTNFWTMLDDRINQIISKIPIFGDKFHITSYMPKGKMSSRDIGRFAAPADYYKNH